MGIKERILKKIEAVEDEQTLQQLEQWLETNSSRKKEELAGNPAHQPKKPSEIKGGDSMFEDESHIAGDKG